jgi:uncharacterized protein (UPF0332 family)
MKSIMDWKLCLKEHIRNVEKDNEKIESIKKMSKARQKVLQNIELDEETASIIAADYYEVIKELLIALLLKNGLKSDNHECLVSYFKYKFPEYEYEAGVIHQLKEARNRITYDGVFIKKDYILRNKIEFENIIKMLFKILEN